MLLKKQAFGCRKKRGQGESKRERPVGERDDLFFFTWMACASLHRVQVTSFLFLFFLFSVCLSVRVGVGVEAWRAVGGGQWGYLWFISGHSSKKPVDAASLSHPLCPSHCFSIGLPLCPWHTGKRCPALPMLPS